MDAPPPVTARVQPLRSRLFWFFVGGALSTVLNAGPFYLLKTRTSIPPSIAYACSLTFVTVVFFIWNYRINFRTTRAWKDCVGRYLGCVGICYALNYAIVMTGLKTWAGDQPVIFSIALIAFVQVSMGGVKFFLYHFWVYPRFERAASNS